jgi:hypothetical protein
MTNRRLALLLALVSLVPLAAPRLSAQPQAPPAGARSIAVTVVDPVNRPVSGLGREQFEVLENGVVAEPVGFMNADGPVTIAIVGAPVPPTLKSAMGAEDVLIEATSLDDAIQRLQAAERRKKAIVVVGASAGSAPAGIQLVRSNEEALQRTVVGLRNQYVVQFVPSDPSAKIEVRFQQSSLLPVLKHTWTSPF